MGFEIEASHHENAPGQHEIDFKYQCYLCCDDIQTFKLVVKTIARKHGCSNLYAKANAYLFNWIRNAL